MARRVFFSFHYDNDVWRANQVRNAWVTMGGGDKSNAKGYIDAADFETIKKQGDQAVKNWIDEQLSGTSVTIVLIGSKTYTREYVEYEIKKSNEKGNGLFGIYIHNLKDVNSNIDSKGKRPCISIDYPTYGWVEDNGYGNIVTWIEKAAKIAGK